MITSYYPVSIFFKPGCESKMIGVCINLLSIYFEVDENHSCKVVLTEDILSVLYSNLKSKEDQTLWITTKSKFLDKQVDVLTLFVEDQKHLNKLVGIIGKETDPEKCKKGSFREHYGGGKYKIPNSELIWFENRVHRPQTLEDAHEQFEALFSEELCEAG